MRPIFLRGSAFKIILAITPRDNYLSKISRKLKMNYTYSTKTIKLLKDEGVVILTKKGRKVMVELTDRGKEIKDTLLKLNTLLYEN